MPTVLKLAGYRFFFYSDEGDPREPAHIHARADGCEAKFWLNQDVTLAYNQGFDARTLRWIARQVEQHRDAFERAWDDHFSIT